MFVEKFDSLPEESYACGEFREFPRKNDAVFIGRKVTL